MKTIIHVNQHVIKSNAKKGEVNPVLTCKTYKTNEYAHEAIVYGQDGLEAARIIYRPDKPLSCGAKVWIETQNKVETIKSVTNDSNSLVKRRSCAKLGTL